MLGYIIDCAEQLVVEKFGVETWHIIKQKAGCDVADGDFFKYEHYQDQQLYDLVFATAEVADMTPEKVIEVAGEYFIPYVVSQGYESLLRCQGNNLFNWLSNVNATHQHLSVSFPKKMRAPLFWCEDNEEDLSLKLYHLSQRGNVLAPLAVGIVREAAKYIFDLEIEFELLTSQGVNGSEFSSWRLTTKDPDDMWKMTALPDCEMLEDFGGHDKPLFKCPFSGIQSEMPSCPSGSMPNYLPHPAERKSSLDNKSVVTQNTALTMMTKSSDHSGGTAGPGGLPATVVKSIFPYHVMVDSNMNITQIGKDLAKILEMSESEILGQAIVDVLEITRPVNADWTWNWVSKLGEQSFQVEPCTPDTSYIIRFSATIVRLSRRRGEFMVILSPDAKNLTELQTMGLTISDLPATGSYRDAVFLREHLSTQMNNALHMEKLGKTLQKEKQLLEQLLPEHAAQGLREGRSVESKLHPEVTMFFSDIVGFTSICKEIYPWDVIDMLNHLYCIMDFLALKFNLFKVETIGDAYVCCSGLPHADPNHAENVANFALAVQHCSQLVLSPVDKKPIQLRIGIHTGPCASGVVGVTNPRYCVFGDTVNVTARHESTGEPGRIHTSKTTQHELMAKAKRSFQLSERGYVEMKGKGKQRTFWLHSTRENEKVNFKALYQLEQEVKIMLQETNFKKEGTTENKRSTEEQKMFKSDEYSESEALSASPEKTSKAKVPLDPIKRKVHRHASNETIETALCVSDDSDTASTGESWTSGIPDWRLREMMFL